MYPQEVIDRYRKVATASVADAVDKVTVKRGFLDESIKPRINEKGIVGPADGSKPREVLVNNFEKPA